MGNFFDFLRIRNEQVEMWEVGSLLIFSEHSRTVLLEEYDVRVENQNVYNRNRNQTGAEIAFGRLLYRSPEIPPNNGPNVFGRIGLRNARRRREIAVKYPPTS